MDKETLLKVEKSIQNLNDKKSRIYFLVQDTKGNARASIRYIYQMAKLLKDNGYNAIILHEKNDYEGVSSWLGEEYEGIPHESIEEQNLQISPEDYVIIPELYGHVLEQLSQIPSGKIVLCQAYDYMLETLQPGTSWSQYGFLKSITTSEQQKNYVEGIMKNVTFDIIPPVLSPVFKEKDKPSKPIISIHTRDQRDTMKIIKSFYLKYPQFRWITFRDMRGISEEQFSEYLRDSFVSVWVDDVSGFGTFPLESMASKTPVIGKVPNIKPEWMNDDNGIWTFNVNEMVDIVADFIQNWLEDNISEKLYEQGLETAKKYQNMEDFQNIVLETFNKFIQVRKENFETQLEKLKVETNE